MNVKAAILAVALSLAGAAAQSPAPGTVIQAQLKSRLDTGHAKVGERIKAQVSKAVKQNGVVVLPKGAQLFGRITEVIKAESKKSPSRIGVLFTRAVYKKQPPIALHAGIAHVFSAPAFAPMDMGTPMPMPMQAPDATAGQSGREPGMGRPGSLGQEPVPNEATAPVPSAAAGRRPGTEIDISLPAASAGTRQRALGSVLSSPRGDLRISSGTRVELQVLR